MLSLNIFSKNHVPVNCPVGEQPATHLKVSFKRLLEELKSAMLLPVLYANN
jgi:hypothetical protein